MPTTAGSGAGSAPEGHGDAARRGWEGRRHEDDERDGRYRSDARGAGRYEEVLN